MRSSPSEQTPNGALVTGGARGIGRAIVEALASRGDHVTIADIDGAAAQRVAAELSAAGFSCRAAQLDVTDIARVDAVVAEADDSMSLATVVCNVGVGVSGPTVDVTEADFDRVMAVNVKGVFLVMQAGLRRMVPRGRGSIVNIASTSAFTSSTTPQVVYDASKGAVRMLTVSTAHEVAAAGIRVNAVAPGTVGTDLVRSVMGDESIAGLTQTRIPMGRLAEPREIAQAVAFLSSDQAEYVTGHTLVVDGGWLT